MIECGLWVSSSFSAFHAFFPLSVSISVSLLHW